MHRWDPCLGGLDRVVTVAEVSAPTLAGRYRPDRLLGGGGMGQVWLGVDTRSGREVAIKILHPEVTADAVAQARLVAEARAVAQIDHPNVVTVLDHGVGVGADPAARFLVMEHVPGEDLSRILRQRHRLPVGEVIDLIRQLAAGLSAAHRAGVIHRDVKPANVLITPDGRVVLTDFGIARSPHGTHLTRTGHIVGTAHYLAPEVAQGQPATAASDLYAVGVLAYLCLTGQHPFPDGPAAHLLRAHIHRDPPGLPERLPAPLRRLVLDLLAKEPDQRPIDAADLARRARDLARTDAGAPGPSTNGAAEASPAGHAQAHAARSLLMTRPLVPPRPAPTAPAGNHRGRSHAATLGTLRWAFGLLAIGVAVVLTVAFGNGPATRVPNVVGASATTARQTLARAGFVVRVQPVDVAHQVAGRVVGQVPAPARSVDAGSVVTLQVATGYLTLSAAAYQGRPCADTASTLASLGLTPVLPGGVDPGSCTVSSLSPVGRIPDTASITLIPAAIPQPAPAPAAPHRHGKRHGHGRG